MNEEKPALTVYIKLAEQQFSMLCKYSPDTIPPPDAMPAILSGIIRSYSMELFTLGYIKEAEIEQMEATILSRISDAMVEDQIGGIKSGDEAMDDYYNE